MAAGVEPRISADRAPEMIPVPTPIPDAWLSDPPEIVVAGDGLYAQALALVLGTVAFSLDNLRTGPSSNIEGKYPQVFEALKRVLLVVSDNMSAAEVVRSHKIIWKWVERLTSDGDQHEIAFLFLLPPQAPSILEESLAVGIGIPSLDPATSGHAAWRRSGSLSELLGLIANLALRDLLPIRARRATDVGRVALARLRAAAGKRDPTGVREAAREVTLAFSGKEYLLDLFCALPSHQNGNRLREWLKIAVTDSASIDWWQNSRGRVAEWLGDSQS